ncbi:MAG: potassium-transporting ATPase subunit KdpA, partial [Gammaproteobacteria bacterium]
MTEIGVFQVILYLAVILALVKPLGWYMTRVYQGTPCGLNQLLNPVERIIYRLSGIRPEQEMNWVSYLTAMLLFNALGLLAVYAIQRLQQFLPLNPQHFPNVAPELAFNTAASFTTNTDWQSYSGENSLSYLTQMLALTVQNFLSAASGMSLLMALIRGIVRHETSRLGNFWVDVVRGTLYILLPLSLLFAVILASQGVIQNFKPYQQIHLIHSFTYQPTSTTSKELTTQIIPMGPVASQVAIKQLGTNGGGYFNANSAHPFENPTPLTNFLEMLALLLIPAALCYTFGMMVKDKRQGWAILLAMLLIFIPFTIMAIVAEQNGNPNFTKLGITLQPQKETYPGGNMEGKETRFGIVNSALWASATTASGNGSVSAYYDSFIPLGGLVPLWLIQLGEVVFGGVGSGLSGMLILIIITVFVAGLMVGRT